MVGFDYTTSSVTICAFQAWEEDLKKVTEVRAHESSVFCLAASDDTIYSCSNDGSIKAWTVNDLTPKGDIFKNESEIYRLFSSNGHLFSSDEYGVVSKLTGDTSKISGTNNLSRWYFCNVVCL